MRRWGGMWIEWTRVWDSCCCYDVPLDSSWLVSLTEEVSASFIISWREKKTYSCKYIFHYCMIKYSQLHLFYVCNITFSYLTLYIHLLGWKNLSNYRCYKDLFYKYPKSIAIWGNAKWEIKDKFIDAKCLQIILCEWWLYFLLNSLHNNLLILETLIDECINYNYNLHKSMINVYFRNI